MQEINPRDANRYWVTSHSMIALQDNSFPEPEMYLRFAHADLRRSFRRNRVNALSNAKRALHLQLELLANAIGINSLPRKKRSGFPNLIEFVSKCGLVTPTIIKKVNTVRNTMEHDYYIPTEDEVLDLIGVTELFLAATSHLMNRFPNELHFGLKYGGTRRRPGSPWSFLIEVHLYEGRIDLLVPKNQSIRDRGDLSRNSERFRMIGIKRMP